MHNSVTVVVYFKPFQSKFMCCCESCHVKQGTRIIGVIFLILTLLCLLFFTETEHKAVFVVTIISSILLLIGIEKENHRYLLPHLILQVCFWISFLLSFILFQILVIVISILVIVGMSIIKFTPLLDSLKKYIPFEKYIRNSGNFKNIIAQISNLILGIVILISATIIFCIIPLSFQIWLFTVVYRCYKYFKELAEVRHTHKIVINHSEIEFNNSSANLRTSTPVWRVNFEFLLDTVRKHELFVKFIL